VDLSLLLQLVKLVPLELLLLLIQPFRVVLVKVKIMLLVHPILEPMSTGE